MKRALAWMAGLAGIAALGRLLSKRSARAPVAKPESAADPAGELRQRLDAQRAAEPVAPEEAPDPAAETLDERRARVHEQARQAIDAMREPGT